MIDNAYSSDTPYSQPFLTRWRSVVSYQEQKTELSRGSYSSSECRLRSPNLRRVASNFSKNLR
jgi:hypothetical protein